VADLRGARFAFNGRDSHSGWNAVIASVGTPRFFGELIESGVHLESLRMVVEGRADVAGIDSTVLDVELRRDPTLGVRLRVVSVIGPFPTPPVAASVVLAPSTRARLRAELIGMHEVPEGRRILAAGLIRRFVPVSASDYDPIRHIAQQIGL
jgi:phosphonate transport system substrate-binding protein